MKVHPRNPADNFKHFRASPVSVLWQEFARHWSAAWSALDLDNARLAARFLARPWCERTAPAMRAGVSLELCARADLPRDTHSLLELAAAEGFALKLYGTGRNKERKRLRRPERSRRVGS